MEDAEVGSVEEVSPLISHHTKTEDVEIVPAEETSFLSSHHAKTRNDMDHSTDVTFSNNEEDAVGVRALSSSSELSSDEFLVLDLSDGQPSD